MIAVILSVAMTGASYINEFLKENCTLKILNMGNNAISDVGISQIKDGLQLNTSLTELNVDECGLSAKGTLYLYKVTLGPQVYMSDKTQPHVLQITCFTSLKYNPVLKQYMWYSW